MIKIELRHRNCAEIEQITLGDIFAARSIYRMLLTAGMEQENKIESLTLRNDNDEILNSCHF